MSPSHVRYRVLAFCVALAAITYLDRVCIAQTAPLITAEMHLSERQMGFVFSAFTLAYALFEIPTGAWGDRVGTRRVLARIVIWWSSFTIATAAAFNYASLLVVRFLFGVGEAGAFPNVSKSFSRWFPLAERGTAQGIFFMGAHLGGGLTPILVTMLLDVMPWRMVFVVFGAIGFVWALAWSLWFRDEPRDHPAVNAGELAWIEAGRIKEPAHTLDLATLRRLVTDRNVVALCLMYFTQAYGFYFNLTWLPTYLKKAHGFEASQLGLLAGLPLILSAAADLTGGVTSDALVRRLGPRAGRCWVGGISLVVAGAALIAGALVDDPLLSAWLIALAGAADSFLLGAAWGTCLDISGPHAGTVTATMNSAGQIGAVLSPIVLSRFLGPSHQDWTTPIVLAGVLYLAGATCWTVIDPRRPIALAPRPAEHEA